jgi:hypothetical protein
VQRDANCPFAVRAGTKVATRFRPRDFSAHRALLVLSGKWATLFDRVPDPSPGGSPSTVARVAGLQTSSTT